MEAVEVVSVVRTSGVSLVGLDWQLFDKTATLRFRKHSGGHLVMRLDGVHLFATRQSMIGQRYIPLQEESWEDWEVRYFDILTKGEFLDRFLDQLLGLPAHVMVYNLSGAGMESAEFVRPVHLVMLTGGGALDAVCEAVQIVGAEMAEHLHGL